MNKKIIAFRFTDKKIYIPSYNEILLSANEEDRRAIQYLMDKESAENYARLLPDLLLKEYPRLTAEDLSKVCFNVESSPIIELIAGRPIYVISMAFETRENLIKFTRKMCIPIVNGSAGYTREVIPKYKTSGGLVLSIPVYLFYLDEGYESHTMDHEEIHVMDVLRKSRKNNTRDGGLLNELIAHVGTRTIYNSSNIGQVFFIEEDLWRYYARHISHLSEGLRRLLRLPRYSRRDFVHRFTELSNDMLKGDIFGLSGPELIRLLMSVRSFDELYSVLFKINPTHFLYKNETQPKKPREKKYIFARLKQIAFDLLYDSISFFCFCYDSMINDMKKQVKYLQALNKL